MASVNKVILVGYCGRDPEVRHAASGDAIANLSMATSERFKDRATGENREQTEWHRLVFFGKLADIVCDYLKKGSLIYVEGKIKTRKWIDQSSEERHTTEIICSEMRMLGGKNDDSASEPSASSTAMTSASKAYRDASGGSSMPKNIADLEDDIPF